MFAEAARCVHRAEDPPDGWPESHERLLSFPADPSEESQGRLGFSNGVSGRNRMERGSQRVKRRRVSGGVGHQ